MLALFCGCSPAKQDKEILAKIDNYSISSEDFMNELNLLSDFERAGKTKEELLEEIIQKKLLLLEAQKEGLDKEASFMKKIEHFWEQSLLRVIIEKKMKEFSKDIKPTDEKAREKVNKRFGEWTDGLRKKAKIYINKEALDKIQMPSGD